MEDRVRESSSQEQNFEIDAELRRTVHTYAQQGREAISQRLRELEREWDIERVLEVNMPVVALTGLGLGAFVHKRWLVFPAVVLGFFLQHALQGWCPPLPLFRKLGYRTQKEIERERYALKMLRGDFDQAGSTESRSDPDVLLKALLKP